MFNGVKETIVEKMAVPVAAVPVKTPVPVKQPVPVKPAAPEIPPVSVAPEKNQ